MKTLKLTATLLTLALAALTAQASPVIDTLNVQGYMKKASGAAVTDGTYTIAFGVFQNGTALWGTSQSVVISGGLFSQALSSTGSNLSTCTLCNSFNND